VRYSVSIEGTNYEVEITEGDVHLSCRLNGREVMVDFVPVGAGVASLLINGKSYQVRRESESVVSVGGRRYEVAIEDARSWQGRKRRESKQAGPQRLTASMPGKVVRFLAHEGETIEIGQGIVVIEAMKMQNEIKSQKSGVLQKITAREGANVNPGEVLAIIE
jgi:biotin carboxyl carrier protein